MVLISGVEEQGRGEHKIIWKILRVLLFDMN